jgi:hypothetical protein
MDPNCKRLILYAPGELASTASNPNIWIHHSQGVHAPLRGFKGDRAGFDVTQRLWKLSR